MIGCVVVFDVYHQVSSVQVHHQRDYVIDAAELDVRHQGIVVVRRGGRVRGVSRRGVSRRGVIAGDHWSSVGGGLADEGGLSCRHINGGALRPRMTGARGVSVYINI